MHFATFSNIPVKNNIDITVSHSYLDQSLFPGRNDKNRWKQFNLFPFCDVLLDLYYDNPIKWYFPKMARIFRLNWTHTESGQIYHYDTFCPGSNTLPPALVITMVPTFRSHPGIKRICASLHGPHKIFLFHFFTNNPFLPLMSILRNGFKKFFSHWTLVSTKYKMVNESLRILNCLIDFWRSMSGVSMIKTTSYTRNM